MSFIRFESARDKEKIRQELREAREQMLQKAQKNAEERVQRELQREMRGERNWMLPTVAAKIDKLNESATIKSSSKKRKKEKSKKSKKSKKAKKKHSSKKRKHASSTTESSSSESESDEQSKSRKKKKHKTARSQNNSSSESEDGKVQKVIKQGQGEYSSSGSSSESGSDNDEWVERSSKKPIDGENFEQTAVQREDWMTQAFSLKTFSRDRADKKPQEKQHIDAYDPAKSTRELNPYWKMTGTGLPAFQKPKEDDDDKETERHKSRQHGRNSHPSSSRNWQKPSAFKSESNRRREPSSSSSSEEQDNQYPANAESEPTPSSTCSAISFLTDQQMNELGAKIIKAEIMGNTDLAAKLKQRLEEARVNRAELKERKTHEMRCESSSTPKEEHILLTRTDQKGNARPLLQRPSESDLWGGRRGKKQKHKRTETHIDGDRVRYFPDDDKYDIKRMFEREKYTSAAESNLEFANIAAKHKNPNDDLEDIFADKIRRNVSDEQTSRNEVQRAIHEQQRLDAQLQNCPSCFDSARMDKSLLISLGDKVHLTIPWHVGLQPGHCILAPTQHISCCTQLDEDTWEELNDFRKALTRMYSAQGKDVIFFEIANKLHRRPHLNIHCVPIRGSHAEMAPFYFKKAIEESEREWSTNKQLVRLRDKGLRSSIPKGLPYFWVHFGMQSGFAHVIEDEDRFPTNFAHEIIGGMLELDPRAWRRPQKESNVVAKVKNFADEWKKYDCTK